ncbi:hypothetical protein HRM2_17330 [Desulforapulum autotrophicum HRM2]|uniref:Uncharacterized protein n=1 Tax=Desulforapulum autotrophicum (strain ATCC 43914 / DSM 3382 / VKM B-1955 / HRM2) TaxID=177437 RepID=C0QB40_DESAH|nr:hypothetical protein [Desulforapulum autotrophicum]ACN14839.1 hypothetical protein HRM2_17330 [Desulforapulum autotrophicum HRM2]
MPSKDFNRMIELGEWLEKFLNPDIKSWDYQKLAKKFIKMYGVDLPLSENDTTLQVLELFDRADTQKKNEYIKSFENLSSFAYSVMKTLSVKLEGNFESLYKLQSNEGQEILSAIRETMTYDKEYFDIDDYIDWIMYAQKQASNAFLIKPIIKDSFQRIVEGISRPWDLTLSELYHSEVKEHYVSFKPDRWVFLLKGYNGLTDQLRIFPDKIKITPTCHNHDYHLSYPGGEIKTKWPSTFPWDVAVVRVFFDFLFLGGQDYFLFCEYCGRFTVIRRKGRKKYCSDICRTTHGREKRAE